MSGSLAWFVVRRLIALGLLLVVISFAVFSLLYIAPGNVIDALLGLNPRTPEMVQALRHEYHLDQPFFTQYWLWATAAAHLHFGNSIQTTLPVIDEIKARLPTSVFLGTYAFLLSMVGGVGLGVVAALRHKSATDRGIVAGATIGLSTPAFVTAIFLLYLFAIEVHWFPVFGKGAGFFDEVWHLTLPAISLALLSSTFLLRHTRAAMIGVLDQDYVVFARARGLSVTRILVAYALRNALIPVVTISTLTFAFLITGAPLIEVTFSLPGVGQLLVQSATSKDLPMVQGLAMVIAFAIMVANLLADLLYMAVDPRIRLGRSAG